MSRIRTLVVAAALLGGCGSDALPPVTGPDAGAREEDLPPPEFFVEEPLGSDRWKSADALPDWVEHPPRRPGVTTFVLDSQSNLRHLAVGRSGDHDRRSIAMTVEAVLGRVVGAPSAAKGGAAATTSLRMVARATREELTTRVMRPGAGLVTAWTLWELPVDDVLAVLPESERPAARAALEAMPPRRAARSRRAPVTSEWRLRPVDAARPPTGTPPRPSRR
jgi:hypothetical protein